MAVWHLNFMVICSLSILQNEKNTTAGKFCDICKLMSFNHNGYSRTSEKDHMFDLARPVYLNLGCSVSVCISSAEFSRPV